MPRGGHGQGRRRRDRQSGRAAGQGRGFAEIHRRPEPGAARAGGARSPHRAAARALGDRPQAPHRGGRQAGLGQEARSRRRDRPRAAGGGDRHLSPIGRRPAAQLSERPGSPRRLRREPRPAAAIPRRADLSRRAARIDPRRHRARSRRRRTTSPRRPRPRARISRRSPAPIPTTRRPRRKAATSAGSPRGRSCPRSWAPCRRRPRRA